MNQGKLDQLVKQEIARLNTDTLRINELKWMGMGKFHSDDYYIYFCGQESSRRNGEALISHVQLFVTSWTATCQSSLSITNSRSLLKLMSIKSVMPSNHPLLCRPLLQNAFLGFQQGLCPCPQAAHCPKPSSW